MKQIQSCGTVFLIFLFLFTLTSCGGEDSDSDSDEGNDDDVVDDDSTDDDAGQDDDNDDDDDDNDDNDDDDDDEPSSFLYLVEGADSRYGDYSGTVEIRFEGEPNFIRVVTFDDLTFTDPRLDKEYEVHTAWTGTFGGFEDPTISVELKVADTIKAYGTLERTDEDGAPVPVTGIVTETKDGGYQVTYQTAPGSTHEFTAQESWTFMEPGQDEPIFQNLDAQIPSHEPMPQWLHSLVFLLLGTYHALPFYDDYRDRPEFIEGIHTIAQTRTDFAWYREHPEAIRVFNHWLDEISMAETMLRARSYGPTLTQKAAGFDEEMPLYFLNSLGMFSASLHGSQPLVLAESGDSLLWTGCYLASQVFRYLSTGEPEALDNWLRALDGLLLSHDMPQDPTTYARAVRPHLEDGNKDWIQGTAPYEAYDWLCCGNNDMIQGLYYGYLLSWIYLPADSAYDEYRVKIAEHAVMLADYSTVANDGDFNEIKAHWLAFLTTGDPSYEQHYKALYSNVLLRLFTRGGGGMFYLWGVSDWSGQHLNTIGQLVLWFLADATGASEKALIGDGLVTGMRTNRWTQTLWPIAAKALADPPSDLDEVYERAVWNMREIPFPKQSLAVDRRIDPTWCASPLPSLFWKLDYFQGGRHQGLFGQPMWGRAMHSNMWVPAPFDYEVGQSDWTDGGGADFLHAYWLGRHFGLFTADD